jgi:hypothetical protein
VICGQRWIVETPVEEIVIVRLCVPLLQETKRRGESESEREEWRQERREEGEGLRDGEKRNRMEWRREGEGRREGGRKGGIEGGEVIKEWETPCWKENEWLTLIGVCNVISIQCLCAS